MSAVHRRTICGWGRYPRVEAFEVEGERLEEITRDVVLTRGLGRSYGDASLPPAPGMRVANSRRADRVLAFDPVTAMVRVQAGLTLHRLHSFFLPRGYFAPVTPGTQDVTVGGMVAADVHGKNHHVAGCFGAHVTAMKLRLPDETITEVRAGDGGTVFDATVGGMGLTGHILEVEFRLERISSPWIVQEMRVAADLGELVAAVRDASAQWPMTVAWSDMLARGRRRGRGIVQCGRWAQPHEAARKTPRPTRTIQVPVPAPPWLLSNVSIAAHNELRFQASRLLPRQAVVSPGHFFYPLDGIRRWNLLYGRRGFTQYQCVLPWDDSLTTYRALADTATRHGQGPFLCVVKDCGEQGRGMLSFPKRGISFALDFPVTDGTQRLVDELNDIVCAAGGRIYLAKDAFTRPEHFAAMEPRLADWLEVRRWLDPQLRLRSALSRRLFGDDDYAAGRSLRK
ncbi:MAG TPA: FAD-binding oxidoreductase [Candidatus Limnocylindrales bacterium]|nr:FAD-binding oxidoreductase [Candidatus Limnocylindrales bacterium]